jgi:hypothetical protein
MVANKEELAEDDTVVKKRKHDKKQNGDNETKMDTEETAAVPEDENGVELKKKHKKKHKNKEKDAELEVE